VSRAKPLAEELLETRWNDVFRDAAVDYCKTNACKTARRLFCNAVFRSWCSTEYHSHRCDELIFNGVSLILTVPAVPPYEIPPVSDTSSSPARPQAFHAHPGENTLLWTVWFTYGAFYFCRTNISAAVPGLKESVDAGGLGLTATQIGFILGATKLAYATGQLINGQFSEQLAPRKLLAVGMFGTAVLNVLFGFGTSLYFLIFIWACNGYSQSLGWTPCVRVLANWIPVSRRGKVIGLIGTGYQVTAVATYVVSGQAASYFGWRGAVWVPAGIMVIAAVIMLVFLEEQPSDSKSGQDDNARDAPAIATAPKNDPRNSVLENFLLTITNPSLWILGISLGLLNACRYGFLDWGLTHLKEVQDTGVGKAALKYAVLPLGAIAGAYLAGWATDRFFGSRRAPVTCILLFGLAALSLAYDTVARTSVPATMVLLIMIGFCIYGPQVLLVGTAPADLARKGTSAAAAGFVNCMGYVGAASGDYFTGRTLDSHGWKQAIFMWAGWAVAAAVAAGLLWNVTAVGDAETNDS
jgi:OPA family glycerol-3-phosphate transporter-like MFS transporter